MRIVISSKRKTPLVPLASVKISPAVPRFSRVSRHARTSEHTDALRVHRDGFLINSEYLPPPLPFLRTRYPDRSQRDALTAVFQSIISRLRVRRNRRVVERTSQESRERVNAPSIPNVTRHHGRRRRINRQQPDEITTPLPEYRNYIPLQPRIATGTPFNASYLASYPPRSFSHHRYRTLARVRRQSPMTTVMTTIASGGAAYRSTMLRARYIGMREAEQGSRAIAIRGLRPVT